MPDYTNHQEVVALLENCQSIEQDNRELVKESHIFVTKQNGQWEDGIYNEYRRNGKPRYTFDQVTPILDQLSGEIERSEFGVQVHPAGDDTDKEQAARIAGLVRGIQRNSNADAIFNAIARNVVTGGFDCMLLKTGEINDRSFDQDIIYERIYNSWDRVWFDTGAVEQDMRDADYAFLLSAIPRKSYNERWPDRSGSSLSQGDIYENYWNKEDVVIIAHVYYAEYRDREIVQTNLGRVFDREEIEPVLDDLAQLGEVIENTRTVKDRYFKVRKFDAAGWIDAAEETVWERVPIIPFFANYQVIENKVVYNGAVLKMMDAQRVFNYAKSREVEEGALAPREKLMMTLEQAKGHQDELATMNVNTDPVQFYNHEDGQPAPFKLGGATVNQSLNVTSTDMANMMRATTGVFDATMGENVNAQSGVAIERLQNRGNNTNSKYFQSMTIGIGAAGKATVDAIPAVYDTERTLRILGPEGLPEMVQFNQVVVDAQTGQPITLNDLSAGKYDVYAEAGPSYDSKQSQTVSTMLEIAQVMPNILEFGADILLRSVSGPEMDKLADRARRQLINAGLIPQNQMTEEEMQEIMQAQMLAAQQGQQPDAATLLAQAEMQKAQADLERNQVEARVRQGELQIKAAELELKSRQLALSAQEKELELMRKMEAQGLAVEKQAFDQMMKQVEAQQQAVNDAVSNLNTQADTLQKLFNATGADAIITPATAVAYQGQAQNIARQVN